jgi:hypothetical protein
MGVNRNGARSFLDLVQKMCKLSHLPGFKAGLNKILGPDAGTELWGFWNPFCLYVESLIALDDHFNRRDATLPDIDGSEDAPFG